MFVRFHITTRPQHRQPPAMGCGGSKGNEPLQMRGNLEGSAVLWGGKLKVEFGALTRGLPKKDQDCFFVRAPGGSDGLVFGICDGHSLSDNRGQEQAEDAAKHLEGGDAKLAPVRRVLHAV